MRDKKSTMKKLYIILNVPMAEQIDIKELYEKI